MCQHEKCFLNPAEILKIPTSKNKSLKIGQLFFFLNRVICDGNNGDWYFFFNLIKSFLQKYFNHLTMKHAKEFCILLNNKV